MKFCLALFLTCLMIEVTEAQTTDTCKIAIPSNTILVNTVQQFNITQGKTFWVCPTGELTLVVSSGSGGCVVFVEPGGKLYRGTGNQSNGGDAIYLKSGATMEVYNHGSSIMYETGATIVSAGTGSAQQTCNVLKFDYTNAPANGCSAVSTDYSENGTVRVSVYPVPAKADINLEFENRNAEAYSLFLFDAQGRIVKTVSSIRTGQVKLERDELKAGLYFYRLGNAKGEIATGKFILE